MASFTTQVGAKVLVTTVPAAVVTQVGAKVLLRRLDNSDGVSTAMKTHLAERVTTLCDLWKITAKNGSVVRTCNHTRNITYNSELYLAVPLKTMNFQMSANLDPGNSEVAAPLVVDGFTEGDLLNGVWDFARVEVVTINYGDPTMGFARKRTGHLGEVSIHNGTFTAEYRSLTDLLNQPVGTVYGPLCPYTLGDANCTKSLAAFTFTGTVAIVGSRAVFTVSVVKPDEYFTLGKITFTSGANTGLSMEIKKQVGTRIVLAQAMPYAIASGVSVTLIAGDDKKRATCRDKFANAVNFGGVPDLPGPDKIFTYPA